MERIRATLRFELGWFDRAYIIDWIVTFVLFVFSQTVNRMPVYQRDIELVLNDPNISHPHGKAQVPGWLNNVYSFYFPLCIAILNGLLHVSSHELHHGVLTMVSSRFLAGAIVGGLKNRVGRFRPDFLDRCKWDAATKQCTGDGYLILDGRRSFPSGHSSGAFVGLGFISLLLLLKFNSHTESARGGLLQSKFGRFVLILSPLAVALWIAVTRVEDFYHHTTDIMTGSVIGILSALVVWHIYWPSPFSARTYREPGTGHLRSAIGPRLLYGRDDVVSREGFELASLDEEEEEETRGETRI